MRKISLILIYTGLSFLLPDALSGQAAEKGGLHDCPRETVTMHFSHECPFTGEVLWFKVYCTILGFEGKHLSSLCFVELVSNENISVIRKKIGLSGGEGSGELLIPGNIPTGIYYVIAYTNWMKNFGEGSFFRKKIVIVNPDKPYTAPSDSIASQVIYAPAAVRKDGSHELKIVTDKSGYAAREKVHARLMTGPGDERLLTGHYSVSVCRQEPDFSAVLSPDPEAARPEYPDSVAYLPDYKGIRLSGKLSDQSGNAAAGALLIMSLPGPGTSVGSSITDSAGNFNFLLEPGAGEEDIVINLPDAGDKISLAEPFWNGFRKLPVYPGIALDRESIEYFREKFACSQLQKKFRNQAFIKHISFISKPDSTVFYQQPYQKIRLADYIQMDSLGEYFHELFPSVRLNRRKGVYNISFVDEKTLAYLDEKPAVFFDGVLFDSYGPLANVPPYEVDRISVLPATYYYKEFYFGGIVDIHTRKSDFNSVKAQPNMTRFIYPKAAPEEYEFDPPEYSDRGSPSGIPDFRYLLYWEPYLKVNGTDGGFDFYTGDLRGTYLIRVTGQTEDGDILHGEARIIVK